MADFQSAFEAMLLDAGIQRRSIVRQLPYDVEHFAKLNGLPDTFVKFAIRNVNDLGMTAPLSAEFSDERHFLLRLNSREFQKFELRILSIGPDLNYNVSDTSRNKNIIDIYKETFSSVYASFNHAEKIGNDTQFAEMTYKISIWHLAVAIIGVIFAYLSVV